MSTQLQTVQRSIASSFRATIECPPFFPNSDAILKKTELDSFCPRKLFEVIFANELTPQCSELLNGIINVREKLGRESNVIFISRKNLTSFIKYVVKNSDDTTIEHPPQLLDHLQRICNNLNDTLKRKEEISRKQLTLIMKHKLINEMYTQYAKDARLDHELCQKEEQLKRLQKNDPQKQIRFSEMHLPNFDLKQNSLKHKKAEGVAKFRMSDYTTYSLPDNLQGSDDLKDHVFFYVFVGFQDPCLLKLLMKYKVPVNCVLQISSQRDVDNCNLTYFWRKMKEITQCGEKFKSLEDTAQLKYVHEGEIPEQGRYNFFRERFEELEKLLMNILDLKRKHLHFLKHLQPVNFKDNDMKMGPFPVYENNLKGVPTEYITIPFILQSMLLEVEKNFVGVKQYTRSCRETPSKDLRSSDQEGFQPAFELCDIDKNQFEEKKPCPFSLEYFKVGKKKRYTSRPQTFKKFYEGDILNMYLGADERAKPVSVSDTKTLMNQKFFHLVKLYREFKDAELVLPHIHHQGSPSTQKSVLSKEQTNHFLNLLYLSSMKIAENIPKDQEDPEKNFICSPYDTFENRNFLPKSINFLGDLHNWYQKFDSLLYRWREPVSISTLAQWLFKAQQEFEEVDSKYCEATNSLVVYFHQNLKPTGTRTKIWKESLRTVTCFRDFCSFYYLEDRWFSKFQPVKYVNYETYRRNEEKYYFERLIENNELYKDYEKYLIPYYYCDNFDLDKNSCSPHSDNIKKFSHIPMVIKPNFESIIDEIKSHPSSKELIKRCNKSFYPNLLTAFDDRPSRFGLTGATNDFFSHDGVQVTIDTCRFHFEDFKLSTTIKFDGHSLVGHYKNGHVDSHLVLEDGTVIKLILPKSRRITEVDSCTCSEDLDTVKSIFGFNLKRFGFDPDSISDYNLNEKKIPEFAPEVKHVIPVYGEDLEKINIDLALIWNKVGRIPHEKNVNRDIKLLHQMLCNNAIHKYVDSPGLRYVKRKYKFLEIPSSFCIRRILKEPLKRKCKPVYRRKILLKNYWQLPCYHKTTPHVKLSLPNGLTLESLTSIRNEDEILIKQTHLHREQYTNILTEDYRLFLDHGTVLIRYSNGNIRILNSEGTIVDFKQKKKKDRDKDECLKSLETCRKMFYKISLSTNRICHNIQDYGRSRRSHLNLSKELKFSSSHYIDVSSLSKLYDSFRMYTLDGVLLKIKEDKVKKKIFTKVLKDWDFQTGQILLERTDGMKVWSRDNGDQAFIFPDGTKITKTVEIEKTPEFFRKKDDQGWIIVNHSYLYEHPLYSPVKFEKNQTTVMLKRYVSLKMRKLSATISFGGESEIFIDSTSLNLTKTCPKCESKCTCNVRVNLSDTNDESALLLVCKDSYEKVFTSDFLGRCQINKNFIVDELNNQKCNHVQKRDYQKAFLINSDLTGDLLWDEKMIIRELDKLEELMAEDSAKVEVEQFTDYSSDSVGISFKKGYYENVNERYLWLKYLNPILFPPLEVNLDNEMVEKYQVCRRVFNILREQETKALYRVVRKLLDDDKVQSGQHNIEILSGFQI